MRKIIKINLALDHFDLLAFLRAFLDFFTTNKIDVLGRKEHVSLCNLQIQKW